MVKKSIENKIIRLGKQLGKEFDIKAIYLFGSHARGEERKHSDIDVCIVSPDFKERSLELRTKVNDIVHKIDWAFDPYITTPLKYRNDKLSPLLHEIRQDAIKVV